MERIPRLLGELEYQLERARYYADDRLGICQARALLMAIGTCDERFSYPREWFRKFVAYADTAIRLTEYNVSRTRNASAMPQDLKRMTPTAMLEFAASPILYPTSHEGKPGYSVWKRA